MQQNINQIYVKVKSKNPFLIMKIQLYFQNIKALFPAAIKVVCLRDLYQMPPLPQL